MPHIAFSVRPTYRDYISVVRVRFRQSAVETAAGLGETVPGWAITLLRPVALTWATFQFFTSKRGLGAFSYTFDDTTVHYAVRDREHVLSWSDFDSIEEHATGFILMRKGSGLLVPKRALSAAHRPVFDSFVATWRMTRLAEAQASSS